MKSKQGVVAFLLLCGLLVCGLWWNDSQAGVNEYPGAGGDEKRLKLKVKVLPPSHELGVPKELSEEDLKRHIPDTDEAHAKGLGLVVAKPGGVREEWELPLDEFLDFVRTNKGKPSGKQPPTDEQLPHKLKLKEDFGMWQYESSDAFPQSSVGVLSYKGAYGTEFCTATLISPNVILTAGNCVHAGPGRNYYTDFEFEVGHTRVHTGQKYGWTSAVTFGAWANGGDNDYNFGFVRLDGEPGANGNWMKMAAKEDLDSTWTLMSFGYPTRHCTPDEWYPMSFSMYPKCLFFTWGRADIEVSTHLICSDELHVHGNNRGAQVYVFREDNIDTIVAVADGWMSFGMGSYNRFPRLTSDKIAVICGAGLCLC